MVEFFHKCARKPWHRNVHPDYSRGSFRDSARDAILSELASLQENPWNWPPGHAKATILYREPSEAPEKGSAWFRCKVVNCGGGNLGIQNFREVLP